MAQKQYYAIGEQDFKSLRDMECVYVDKTHFIATILERRRKYFFLARPRRFGKSLFLSTLQYFFEGKRELFKGLYIDSTNWDWDPYPVIRLDLNTDKFFEQGILDGVLDDFLGKLERKYKVETIATQLSTRFRNVIEAAHLTTGKQVVILVDEYDKPLIGNLNKEENFEHYRAKLASIYSNFKSAAEHIRLVFLTGVSRFSKLSVFSDLNNLQDITFSDDFADICGITEKELSDYFHPGIERFAKEYNTTYEDVTARLKKNYDGYRFAPKGNDIYNPWSVLNAMSEGRISDYWNSTGAASIIAQTLYNAEVDIENILHTKWTLRELAGLDLRNANPTALLYQTGYLTIADYDWETDEISLKVPNDEVKEGLFRDLLPLYVKPEKGFAQGMVMDLKRAIRNGEPEKMMKLLDAYFAGIPYDLKMENENNFHNAFYILLTLIGIEAKAEVHTSAGRIDLLIENNKYIYIIELKYNSTPEQAIRQIDKTEYAHKFHADSRKLFKIGVSFSSKTRSIKSWKIIS